MSLGRENQPTIFLMRERKGGSREQENNLSILRVDPLIYFLMREMRGVEGGEDEESWVEGNGYIIISGDSFPLKFEDLTTKHCVFECLRDLAADRLILGSRTAMSE